MSIVTMSPRLSYVSSADVSSVADGLTKYEIFFDATLVTLGNVIMFEYKLQNTGVSIPDLDNTEFGFVSIEQAVTSGIANQYIISVPASGNIYNGTSNQTIQVRVYCGEKALANKVVVTEWSNVLDVNNPPATPVIYIHSSEKAGAYFDPIFDGDRLFVLLKDSENPYDYNTIKFVVCYFYQDQSNNTVWNVSEPIAGIPTQNGPNTFHEIVVNDIGTVSNIASQNKVYVSVHAVYDWSVTDASGVVQNFYAVSYMSNEVVAVSASSDSDPNITSVVYNVYQSGAIFPEIPGTQTMTVSWDPPGNASIPFYAVANYNLYYSTNGGVLFNPVSGAQDLSANTFSYIVDVSSLIPSCGERIRFRVNAVNVEGQDTPSPVSDDTYRFTYSQAVTNLVITNTSFNGSTSSITVNFNGVSATDKGCGAGLSYVVLINGDESTPDIGSLAYNSGENKTLTFTGLTAQSGTVEVYLKTQDTNSADEMNGTMSVNVPYIANTLTVDPVDYQVETQNMNLSWNNVALTDWSVTKYSVYFSTNNGSSWALAPNGDVTGPSYVFNASSYTTAVTTLTFKVEATMASDNGITTYVIPSSNQVSKNTFTYADAVTDLVITNTSVVIGLVYITVNFTGVSTGGKGLGAALPYVVKINGVSSTPVNGSGASELIWVAGKQYALDFVFDATDAQTGTVEVYLQTTDTNAPNAARDGESVSTPYIASTLTLDPVYYWIYNTLSNLDQNIDLSWNNPVQSGWSVVDYNVQYSTDGNNWSTFETTTNIVSTFNHFTIFNVSISSANVDPYDLRFRVLANMQNDSTSTLYQITSNTESKNTFRFAENVAGAVDWCVAGMTSSSASSPSKMDMHVSFTNPTILDINDTMQNFTVTAYDASNGVLETKIIPYDASAVGYEVYFDQLAYSASGIVKISTNVVDTNAPFSSQTSSEYDIELTYTASILPLFRDVSLSGAIVTGKIITPDLLKTTGDIAYYEGSTLVRKSFTATSDTTGVTIVKTTLSMNIPQTFQYAFTINTSDLGIPTYFGIAVSNNAGIGTHIVG